MTFETWLLFVLTEAVLSATPGPAVLFVLSQAIRRGQSKSIWASGGILSANAVYFVLSATSLGAMILASYDLFFLIKWIGAAYLIFLGLRSFLHWDSTLTLPELNSSEISMGRIWRDGFLLQMANPKALVFFVAILPQFIDTRRPVGSQVLILGMSSILVESCILVAYGHLADRAWSAARSPKYEKLTNRLAGGLLIGAGLGLANLRKA